MAKSKSFNAAEDLLFASNKNRSEDMNPEKKEEVKREESFASVNEAEAEKKDDNTPNKPVGDKLILVHKEPKSVRKNWLITPSNDRDLRAEAQSHGISVNELINLIFEQRYGRTRG